MGAGCRAFQQGHGGIRRRPRQVVGVDTRTAGVGVVAVTDRGDEGVVTGTTGDDVVQAVAGAGEVAGAGVGQILEVRAQSVAAQRGLDGIGALVRCFDDNVTDVTNDVGVVAGTTGHRVRAGPVGQHVIAVQPQYESGNGGVGAVGRQRVVAGCADDQPDCKNGGGDIAGEIGRRRGDGGHDVGRRSWRQGKRPGAVGGCGNGAQWRRRPVGQHHRGASFGRA